MLAVSTELTVIAVVASGLFLWAFIFGRKKKSSDTGDGGASFNGGFSASGDDSGDGGDGGDGGD